MKNKLGLWLACILYIGCIPVEPQIKVYFDPSGATYLEKIPLILRVDDRIILDTVVENSHVNKSLLMISFKKNRNDGVLFAEVNGKKELIKQLNEVSIKCTDVFLGYDDHSLIFKEARKIEIEKKDKHIPTDFKQLFDSIKASSGNKYHQINFNIKEGDCQG
ncbi:MAG: hypothetical protein P0Y49_18730 [Candidatus Pedobacter colombiensis]|uniref:Uncharacterized protein n=1 Tax=Candidatus Pedobacter colombiensis TaxID=3121371 RepID=A0AAJ5W753_9SPHI|nr:hypothetical protein [Pedobacter sp.]WEK18815.1 MAG: hypothetical protein P0Y49_18730 [Pedobacter sp.]